MKIAIQRHPTRGKEVIQTLESFGGYNKYEFCGIGRDPVYYYINKYDIIDISLESDLCNYKLYTLEEFEKEFPFKIGDIVQIKTERKIHLATIAGIVDIDTYKVEYPSGGGISFINKKYITIYKEMKEERNITLTLEKAKEWYNSGGEFKEVVLQAFTEQELNPLPKSWEEYYQRYQVSPIIFGANVPNKYFALWKLEQLRDCYRQGWVPNWKDRTETKYCIIIEHNIFNIRIHAHLNEFLSFQSEKVAKEFLKNFEPLIKEAGDLI